MKLLITVVWLSFCYCNEITKENTRETKERRIAGGGNYGGFIGLTTYGAGPFLVKGKYDTVPKQGYDEKQKDDLGKDDVQSNANVGQIIQKEQLAYKHDDYLEDLGYNFDGCIGQYEKKINGNTDSYGRQNRDDDRFNQVTGNYSNYYDDETRDVCDYVFGYTGPTANDEPENIIRPCALDDWQCIRNFFAANSKCKPAYGPIPDPLYIDVNTVFYSIVNLTVALPNLQVRGLSSAKIRDFYVNKESGNLVFTIDVTNFNETIPRAYFKYRRTAKESIVLADYATILYRAITFTAVIPKVPNLRLELADIHPFIQAPNPVYYVGPGAFNSTDPDVVTAITQFNLLVPFDVREGLLFQAQLFTAIYIQTNICDFGLQLIRV